ncbi:matrixin family metalloprotease [Arthrobacter sp. CJ23]|uniref:matrixin family metalloprotease n=1 Tax=Arthrobacter sp. CJ23 TaxID=2972479 RepID=UPI00215C2CE7|nr:matrixin family metalloprotease [Arthrobacter sp. CJ23]UVJ40477.1 matrixin family metalloprotease [Arthrobacter sp. CJ23]
MRHSSIAAVLFLLGIISLVCAGAYFSGDLRPALFGAQDESQVAGPGIFPFGQRRDPVPGLEEANAPMGSPPPLDWPSDSYKFLAVKGDGSPLTYSPCRPIHYVVNTDLAHASWQRLLEEAVKEASWASGLQFIYDGTTDEVPSNNRAGYQPDKYGNRWAPVLIAWTTPDVVPRLDGQTVGLGGSSSIALNNGYKAYVTGSVALDAPQFGEILDSPGGEAIGIAVIMHELGHLLGLDHVSDPEQLMFDEASWVRDYAAGDRAGLAKLGTGPCSKDF